MSESAGPFGADLPFLPTREMFPPLTLKTRNLEILRSVVLILAPPQPPLFPWRESLRALRKARDQRRSVRLRRRSRTGWQCELHTFVSNSQCAAVFVVWMCRDTKDCEGIGQIE